MQTWRKTQEYLGSHFPCSSLDLCSRLCWQSCSHSLPCQRSLPCFDWRQILVPHWSALALSDWCHLLHCGKIPGASQIKSSKEITWEASDNLCKGEKYHSQQAINPHYCELRPLHKIHLWGKMGMCHSQIWAGLAKVQRPSKIFPKLPSCHPGGIVWTMICHYDSHENNFSFPSHQVAKTSDLGVLSQCLHFPHHSSFHLRDTS